MICAHETEVWPRIYKYRTLMRDKIDGHMDRLVSLGVSGPVSLRNNVLMDLEARMPYEGLLLMLADVRTRAGEADDGG